jgi:4-hydroxy-tetrahydrodipicolinate reductase
MNRIALLGRGKTGGRVIELVKGEITVFDSKNPPTLMALKNHDVIISFLPGRPFKEYIPLLLESKIPVVTGSTGLVWPTDLDEKLKVLNITWIKASNFSLGMAIIKSILPYLGKADEIFDDYDLSLNEIHHVHKKDAPSGTALSWKDWIGLDIPITSEREGDEVGTHSLNLKTPFEEITLKHRALDRKIFAQGALWAAEKVINEDLPSGLIDFQELIIGRNL